MTRLMSAERSAEIESSARLNTVGFEFRDMAERLCKRIERAPTQAEKFRIHAWKVALEQMADEAESAADEAMR